MYDRFSPNRLAHLFPRMPRDGFDVLRVLHKHTHTLKVGVWQYYVKKRECQKPGATERLEQVPPTFPYPDGFVSTATCQESTSSGVCDPFAFRLVSFQRTNALPRSLFSFFVPEPLPDPNVRIERARGKRVPRRRPSQCPNRLRVPGGDRNVQFELGFRSSSSVRRRTTVVVPRCSRRDAVVVQSHSFICRARREERFRWVPRDRPRTVLVTCWAREFWCNHSIAHETYPEALRRATSRQRVRWWPSVELGRSNQGI